MRYFILSAAFLMLTVGNAVLAQTTVQGTILDEQGEGIIGGNVYLKDTYDGTSTDELGNFTFETFEEDSMVLVVSYLGYEALEQPLFLTDKPVSLELKLTPLTNELDMVVISAGAFEASDEKKAVVLRPLDIVTTAGAMGDMYGAINTLPGTQAVGEEGRLFVRGGAAYETRTFIDGMAVQSPYGSSVPDLPARGRFSPFLFKGTTFSTGGYSAEYGQALSSALALETQDLAPETVTGISLMSVGLGLSHTERWKNTSLSASIDHTNLAPYVGMVDQNIEWDRPFQSWSGQFIFRQKVNETGMFKIQANGSYSDFALQYPDAANIEQLNPLSLNNDNYFVNTSYRTILGEKWTLFNGFSYSHDREVINQDFTFDKQEQSIQYKSTLSYHASDALRIKGGAEWWHQSRKDRFEEQDADAVLINLEEDYGAAFVEADVYFTSKLVARMGVRGEYSALLQKGNIAPRLSLAYKTGAKSQVALAYGQFFQNPENEWLRFNQDVSFEEAQHLIANYQIIKNGRTFRAEAYWKKYDQLLRFDASEPWLSDNSGYGHAQGVDLFFRDRKSIKNGDFWVSYSYLDTERLYQDFAEASQPGFASAHNFSAVYKHWIPDLTTQVGMTYRFASPRAYNDPNSTEFNAERTRPYHDLSLNASYLTNWFGQFTIIHCSVSNVLGIDQVFSYRFSNQPDANGQFTSMAVRPPAKRFFFVGIFMSIGQRFKVNAETINN